VNKYEIHNLTPYTTYEISVAAGNYYYQFGEESNTSFLTSEEGELLKDMCFTGSQNMVPLTLMQQSVYFN
jgi:hypothetical protein